MGDPIKNLEIFKRVGFDTRSQWILYDDLFDKFFTWFNNHITEDNILEDSELFDYRSIVKAEEYLRFQDLDNQVADVKSQYPSILQYNDDDVKDHLDVVEEIIETGNIFHTNCKLIEDSKNNVVHYLNRIQNEKNIVENSIKTLTKKCLENAQQLQEIQESNKKLCKEFNESLVKIQSPPLFIYQMPLDQYFTLLESHYHYFMMYMKENFKIQEDYDDDLDTIKVEEQLDKLRNQICRTEKNYVDRKQEFLVIKRVMNELNLDNVHFVSLSQIKKEIRDLKLFNEHSSYSYETLLSEIDANINELSQHQIESIVFENCKPRLERANTRLDRVKFISSIVSDAITNAELLWIFMQIDVEKMKSKCDNIQVLENEQQVLLKRINSMRHIQELPPTTASDLYMRKISEIMSTYIQTYKTSLHPKANFYEYQKQCKAMFYMLEDIVNKKYNGKALAMINEIDAKKKSLFNYVFDSPVNKPIFGNVKFLESIFEAEQFKQENENKVKQLRSVFQDNIRERMNSDQFWVYKQLLWIWFLTEPKKVLYAVSEVSKAASKIPTNVSKCISGIKRKPNKFDDI